MIELPFTIEGFRPLRAAPLVEPIKAGASKKRYLSEAVFLDTETSKIIRDDGTADGWIYQWAFRFAGYDCIGRYPNELVEDLDAAVRRSVEAAGDDYKVIVYIHNAAYDLQYLKDWLFDKYGTGKWDMLAVGPHKIITFSIGPFEFRCSWKLSNRSLYKWGKDLGIKQEKKKGLIDYEKIRYQDDDLTFEDWLYMLYDIWALEECVRKQLAIYGDDLAHVPLTSTGYVRRESRRHFRENVKKNRREFLKCRMSPDVYDALSRAGAGGICHGNRNFEDVRVDVDAIWYKNPDAYKRAEPIWEIGHVDYMSHYPSQIRASDSMYGFPVDKFTLWWKYRPGCDKFTWRQLDAITAKNCALVEIFLHDVTIKEGITLPYLMRYKCYQGRQWDYGVDVPDETGMLRKGKEIVDNGRILQFTGGTLLVCTEWDLKWIRKQYNIGAYEIVNVWIAPRGKAPDFLCDTVDEFFVQKTMLKKRVKMLKDAKAPIWDIIEAEIDLMKSKNGLNGIFGMAYTDPVRPEITMDPKTGSWHVPLKTREMIEDQLDGKLDPDTGERKGGYYANWNNFMTYAIGVYVTALARNELMEAVEAIGYKYFLYCDTDSIFFIVNEKTLDRLRAINAWRRIRAEKIGAFVDMPDGERVYYDVLDDEKENITSFKFLHAKAYSYITDGGTDKEDLHAVIAGVSEYSPDYDPKENKGTSRVEELGSIDNLKHGASFTACGGTTCSYVESPPMIKVINGHVTQIASSAIIQNITKTMSGPIAKDEVWWMWDQMEDNV